MQVIRAVGRDAAARKYDLLSAMMAHALAGDKHRQRLILRLMVLMTARYNWQRDELAVGQREIGRLWCVDERTVKRDMSRLRTMGWVEVKQQGARGRVSVLSLNIERIFLDTRQEWSHIGPDFVARVGGEGRESSSNVVPLHRTPAVAVSGGGLWAEACSYLAEEDRVLYESWFSTMSEAELADGCLTLLAPTRFHANYVQTHLLERIRIAVRRCNASAVRLRVIAP